MIRKSGNRFSEKIMLKQKHGPHPEEPRSGVSKDGPRNDKPSFEMPRKEARPLGMRPAFATPSIRIKLAERTNTHCAGALVFVLAVGERRATVPANPRRNRRHVASGIAALLIAREIDDVAV